jgi:spermidine synthase
MATQLLTTHLPLLLHPAPRDLLLIGLASGVSLGAALRHPLDAALVVEIVPSVPGAARLFERDNGAALDDPRVRVVIDDARSHLMARPDRYDVIASQPSNPWVSGVPNLFTVDFYRLARRRLRPGGLFMQWVQAYRLEPRDLRGVVRSFLEVFPAATLWEESAGGGDYFLVAGDAPIVVDPERWRAAPNPVWTDLRRAGIDGAADLLSRFVCGPDGLRAFAAGAPLHTDDDLYLEWRAPLALFRDTLATQISTLNRYREPVIALLPEGYAGRDPDLMADLGARLRRRSGRLAIAASLKHADRMALVDPHLAAGIDRLRTGRYNEAVMALTAAAAGHPDSASAHFLLGEAYRGAGLCGAAVVAFREALRRDADMASAWNGMGSCLLREGALEKAERALREAVRFDPGNAVARNNLGTALLRAGDPDGAERLFRDALAADPALSAARANVGLVLRRRGDLAGALDEYRAALDLDPLNLDARYNLAAALKQSGDAAGATGALRELLAVDPTDGDAVALLESLEREGPGAPR